MPLPKFASQSSSSDSSAWAEKPLIERILPASLWPGYLKLRRYSMGVLFLVVFLLPGVLSHVFDRAIDLWSRLLV